LTSTPTEVRPSETGKTITDESADVDKPWLVIVWNDPINLMTYVTFVLQKLFGYSKEKATKLMLDVHNRGRAVVATGSHDEAERDVARLHHYGLSATIEQS
jgi:ATP-dependent Clp protease adaptor protein ClpS